MADTIVGSTSLNFFWYWYDKVFSVWLSKFGMSIFPMLVFLCCLLRKIFDFLLLDGREFHLKRVPGPRTSELYITFILKYLSFYRQTIEFVHSCFRDIKISNRCCSCHMSTVLLFTILTAKNISNVLFCLVSSFGKLEPLVMYLSKHFVCGT